MATFNRNDKFDAKKGYIRLRWGDQSKVLDTELTEFQKIMADQLSGAVKNLYVDGFLNKSSLVYSAGTLTVPPDTIYSAGRVIPFQDSMSIAAGNSTTVYLAIFEKEIIYTDTVYRNGNLSGGAVIADNGILDSQFNFETSRRTQLQIQLMTSNADATKVYLPVASISAGGVLTDNRIKAQNFASALIREDSTKPFVLEVRTSDPASPVPGQMWFRSDL